MRPFFAILTLLNALAFSAPAKATSCDEALLLAVHAEGGLAVNVENLRCFSERLYSLKDGRGRLIAEVSTHRDPLNYLEIEIERTDGSKIRPKLPDEIGQRILRYLIDGKPKEPFDCNCFIHYVNGIPVQFGSVTQNRWRFETFEQARLNPGQSVLMGNPASGDIFHPTHAALYLGEGLYLSKFGPNGNLMITHMEDMAHAFDATQAYIMVPIPER